MVNEEQPSLYINIDTYMQIYEFKQVTFSVVEYDNLQKNIIDCRMT